MEKNRLYNGLPVYQLEIDETDKTGMTAIALVDSPATEINWMKFDKQIEPIKFAKNKDKRLITAPIMLADTPIYRFDRNGEYYVVFTPEQIELMSIKFFVKGNNVNVNEMHNQSDVVKNLHLVENWFVRNPENDASNEMGFKGITKGTVMGTYYVEDEQYWNEKVLSEEFKGFSLEGDFNMVFSKIDVLNKLEDIVNLEDKSDEEIIQALKNELDK